MFKSLVKTVVGLVVITLNIRTLFKLAMTDRKAYNECCAEFLKVYQSI